MKDVFLNSTIQKMIIGLFAIAILIAVAVGKHFYPDLDPTIVGILVSVGLSLLTSVGAYHLAGTKAAQGGFASVRLLAAIAGLALGLLMLAGCATPPNADQVTAIRNACAIDAGVRPTVTVLLTLPGLAKPEEIAAVTAARAIIDPVCANPEASAQQNSLAAVSGATATVLGIVTQMQARKAAAK